MNNKKAQAAVEFLTIYGWVILLVLVVIMFLYYYGTFDPLKFVQKQCNFEPGLGCTTYKFEQVNSTHMKLTIQFYNNLGYDISFLENSTILKTENIGKMGKANYTGSCRPNLPGIVKAGELATCIYYINNTEIVPSLGKNLNLKLELNYTNCNADPNYVLNKSCSFGTNYQTTGSIVTPMEKVTPTFLYCGDRMCNASIGENPANCPADCTPPTTILINAYPNLVAPDGVQYSVIKVQLLNATGQPMRGIEVNFVSIPIGKLNTYSNITNSTGEATAIVTSDKSGVAKITAYTGESSNETTVTFRTIPLVILLDAYDSYLGVCGQGSYIIANVRDNANRPVGGMKVNFTHNASASSLANFTQTSGYSDENSGLMVTYFRDNTLEKINITARVDMDEFNLHLKNSTTVTAVNCQACDVPVRGDWIVDKTVVCENATINLTGDLNISINIDYVKNPGDLTFKNVTLTMNLTSDGQYGVYVNRNGGFRIFDNDNNPTTTTDRSSISSTTLPTRRYPFIIAPDAAEFKMHNSYLNRCGYNISPINWPYSLGSNPNITGLSISIDSVSIVNNTINNSFIGVLFYNSKNHTIHKNDITSTYEAGALYFYNIANTTITNNSLYGCISMVDSSQNKIENNSIYGTGQLNNPGVYLSDSTNNTIVNNRLSGADPAFWLQSSSYNNITDNNATNGRDIGMIVSNSDHNKILRNRVIPYCVLLESRLFYGLTIDSSEYNEISQNYFSTYPIAEDKGWHAALYLSSSSHNNITNNSFHRCDPQVTRGGDNSGDPYPTGDNITIIRSSNITLLYNNFTSFLNWGNAVIRIYSSSVELRNSTFNSISLKDSAVNMSNNYIAYGTSTYSGYLYGIYANNSIVNITNNRMYRYSAGAGNITRMIYIEVSKGIIERNNITDPYTPYGIQLSDSNMTILENTIMGSGLLYGIQLSNSNATIHKNNISSSCGLMYGINSTSSEVIISNNTIRNFNETGVYLKDSGPAKVWKIENNSIISRCAPADTWVYGINVLSADGVTIKKNLINVSSLNRGIGILLGSSDSSLISNNITNNYYGVWCASSFPTFSGNNYSYNTWNCSDGSGTWCQSRCNDA